MLQRWNPRSDLRAVTQALQTTWLHGMSVMGACFASPCTTAALGHAMSTWGLALEHKPDQSKGSVRVSV